MKSILQQSHLTSPIAKQSLLRPKGRNYKKTLAASLILTSLVDVFSILVIYLLVNTGAASSITDKMKDISQLPQAQTSELLKNGVLIRIADRNVFIEDQQMKPADVLSTLHRLAEQRAVDDRFVVVEAGKNTSYDVLSPVLFAATRAGFSKVHFAVLKGGG